MGNLISWVYRMVEIFGGLFYFFEDRINRKWVRLIFFKWLLVFFLFLYSKNYVFFFCMKKVVRTGVYIIFDFAFLKRFRENFKFCE